jgi:hypothetical protein
MIRNTSPSENFFAGISQSYKLLKQRGYSGKFTYLHEFFVNLEICTYFNELEPEEVFRHIVMLRSAWIPKPYRGRGEFILNMEILLEYASGAGVAILAVANPFELSNKGKTARDFENIFVDDRGFRLVEDYEEKQRRQRDRFHKLGFTSTWLGNIGDRKRVKKEDCLLFLPERLDSEIRKKILAVSEVPIEYAQDANLLVGR